MFQLRDSNARVSTVRAPSVAVAGMLAGALFASACGSADIDIETSELDATVVTAPDSTPVTSDAVPEPVDSVPAEPIESEPVDTEPEPVDTEPEPVESLDELLQRVVDADALTIPSSPGQSLSVLSPDVDVDVAAGDVEPETPFRIASVTKTFTAATVMRLVETGELDLADSLVTAGVPARFTEMLAADGYDVEAITVSQLLTHSSGIADYADDAAAAEEGPYKVAVLSDPSRRWTPEEQVRFAVDNHDPVGAPEELYAYSDTGYVLLGQIIEATTGESYAASMRGLLRFDELGLTSTYLESLEPAPAGVPDPVVQYLGGFAMDGFDPSFDLFGGGGLVSTTGDLTTFFRALGSDEVFDDPATFEQMTSLSAPAPDVDERAGIVAFQVGDVDCWLHGGFWGVIAMTCPAADLTIAHTINQAVPDASWDDVNVLTQVFLAAGMLD